MLIVAVTEIVPCSLLSSVLIAQEYLLEVLPPHNNMIADLPLHQLQCDDC